MVMSMSGTPCVNSTRFCHALTSVSLERSTLLMSSCMASHSAQCCMRRLVVSSEEGVAPTTTMRHSGNSRKADTSARPTPWPQSAMATIFLQSPRARARDAREVSPSLLSLLEGAGLRLAEALADALERRVSGRVAGAVVGGEPRAEDAGGRRERASPGEGGDDAEHRAARCVVLSEAPEARVARCIREYFEYFKSNDAESRSSHNSPPRAASHG